MRQILNLNNFKFFIIIILGCPVLSQAQNTEEISFEEYEVINTVFPEDLEKSNYIYHRVYYDKGWASFFEPENFKNITSRVGIPVKITDEELRDILSDEVLKSINNCIMTLKPLKLNQDKLNKSISISNSFDEPGDLKKGVQRISKPIIIGDIAVFRKIGFSEAPIYILKKENEIWNIIYTFYDWLILE